MAATPVANIAELLAYQQTAVAMNQRRSKSWILQAIPATTRAVDTTGTPRGDAWLAGLSDFIPGAPGAPKGSTAWKTPVAEDLIGEASYPVRQVGHVLELEDRIADRGRNALVDNVARTVRYVAESIDRQLTAYFAGDGTGTLMKSDTVTTTTTVNGVASDYYEYTRWLEPFKNALIDAGTTAGYNARVDSVGIASITDDNTFELAASDSITANDIITFEDTGGLVPVGVDLMVSASGTYAGLNRATAGNEAWKSVSATVSAAISNPVLDTHFNRTRANSDDGEGGNYVIWSDDEVLTGYLEIARPYMRVMGDINDLPIGNKSTGVILRVGGRPVRWIGDFFAGRRRIYTLDLSTIKLWQTAEPGYQQPDALSKSAGPKFLFTSSRSHQLRYAWDLNWICTKPRANGVLLSVTPVTS